MIYSTCFNSNNTSIGRGEGRSWFAIFLPCRRIFYKFDKFEKENNDLEKSTNTANFFKTSIRFVLLTRGRAPSEDAEWWSSMGTVWRCWQGRPPRKGSPYGLTKVTPRGSLNQLPKGKTKVDSFLMVNLVYLFNHFRFIGFT